METTLSAVEFFYEHAGWNYNPEHETEEQGHRRCAEALAKAERWAREAGVEFSWEDDWEVGDHTTEFDCYEDGGPETCERAAASFEGEVLASLCCIDDATDEYRRVVEAELALQAWAEIFGPKPTFLRADPDMTESTLEAVRAALFGVLVGLARDTVKHYQSDLYHDAIWLHGVAMRPMVFFYGVRESGTDLSFDEDYVRQLNTKIWRIELIRSDNGKWEAITTRLPEVSDA